MAIRAPDGANKGYIHTNIKDVTKAHCPRFSTRKMMTSLSSFSGILTRNWRGSLMARWRSSALLRKTGGHICCVLELALAVEETS